MRIQIMVARNLRRLRVAKGLAQESLAVDANVDRTYVSRLERGLENPSIGLLDRLAKSLGTDVRDFFNAAAAKNPVAPLRSGRKRAKALRL